MSGTSLDGLDMAFCNFSLKDSQWSFEVLAAETVSYPPDLYDQLKKATKMSALEMAGLDVQLARWMGKQTNGFIERYNIAPDLVASHGHTIFHQPEKRLTQQIGNGNMIAAVVNRPVAYDFRTLDVALGGQGAPLVPIGDRLLFGKYDYCLNLGGIANISYEQAGKRLAFDICPCNMALNHLAAKTGKSYDEGGEIAQSGQLVPDLLQELNALPFYRQPHPKSLGYEWVHQHVISKLDGSSAPLADLMHTMAEHIAEQIAVAVRKANAGKGLLATGGGAFNSYLMKLLQAHLPSEVQLHIPDADIINYKEAIIFAFLGVLRARSEVNCLSDVTGASRDSCGGSISGIL